MEELVKRNTVKAFGSEIGLLKAFNQMSCKSMYCRFKYCNNKPSSILLNRFKKMKIAHWFKASKATSPQIYFPTLCDIGKKTCGTFFSYLLRIIHCSYSIGMLSITSFITFLRSSQIISRSLLLQYVSMLVVLYASVTCYIV